MHDQLLAQSAADRLTSTCHELVIEGDSYRKRQRRECPANGGNTVGSDSEVLSHLRR